MIPLSIIEDYLTDQSEGGNADPHHLVPEPRDAVGSTLTGRCRSV